jgi:PleD family two-component response regulator
MRLSSIFMVGDDRIFAERLAEVLVCAGHRVEQAFDGEELTLL